MGFEKNLVPATKEGQALFDAQRNAHEPPDWHRNVPSADPACLYGLIGDIARAGSETTEANPYAVALNAMVYLSCAVGRGPYMSIGNTLHHARLFGLHIGRSGIARKGDAVSLVYRVAQCVGEGDRFLAPQIHKGGLSTREGLAYLIHDSYMDGKTEVPAKEDKRLWVVESEFVNVLQQSKREGNTLSPALRDCWDGTSISPATKSNRMGATDPHVCVSAAITPVELRSKVATNDLSNGFMNRFLPIWAERMQTVPFPIATTATLVDELARRVCEMLQFCGAGRWVDRNTLHVMLSVEAKALWEELYRGELNDRSHGERINALIERRAPMLLRIAMLMALSDCSNTVQGCHLHAALAWIRFSVASVKFVFASGKDEAETAEVNEAAEKIEAFVRQRGRVTRTHLTTECFSGHASKDKIDAALDLLLTATPPRIVVGEDRSGAGRPRKFYRLPAKYASNANKAQGDAFVGRITAGEQCEEGELSVGLTSQTRIVREVNEVPQTLSCANSSPISQSSHINSVRKLEGGGNDDEVAV